MLKDTSLEQFDLLTDKQEERIQRFIECLQESSIENYKYFIKLLYETKQGALITKLVLSCKILCIEILNIFVVNLIYVCQLHLFMTMFEYLIDAELHVNIIPGGKEGPEEDKVCRTSFNIF